MKRMLEKKYINTNLYEGYSSDIASTKKIYFHPLRLQGTTLRITATILNNDRTQFTSFNDILTYVRSLLTDSFTTFDLLVSGGYAVEGVLNIPYLIRITSSSAIMYYIKPDGDTASANTSGLINSVDDGVNPIN